jgi:hypothetical protein
MASTTEATPALAAMESVAVAVDAAAAAAAAPAAEGAATEAEPARTETAATGAEEAQAPEETTTRAAIRDACTFVLCGASRWQAASGPISSLMADSVLLRSGLRTSLS